jgi:hypothetical protein
MGLIHPPFGLHARNQRRLPAGHGRFLRTLLFYLAAVQPKRRPKTLLLIERAGIAKTILSDRMVRIEAAKAPSFFTTLVTQFRLTLGKAKTHALVLQAR